MCSVASSETVVVLLRLSKKCFITESTRTAEHRGISCRTGRPLTAPPHSAIRLHCEQVHDVPVKADNFSIIDSTQNTVSLSEY